MISTMFSRGRILCDLATASTSKGGNNKDLEEDRNELVMSRRNDVDAKSEKDLLGLCYTPEFNPRSNSPLGPVLNYIELAPMDCNAPTESFSSLIDISANTLIIIDGATKNNYTENVESEIVDNDISNPDFLASDGDDGFDGFVPNSKEKSIDSKPCTKGRSGNFHRRQNVSSELSSSENDNPALNLSIKKVPLPEDADITSEPEEQSFQKGRKRVRNVSSWKCNIRKRKAVSGHSYVSKKGKIVPSKMLKPGCDPCKRNCTQKVSYEARSSIFQQYWSEDKTWELKRQYILSRVTEIPVERHRRRADLQEPPKRCFTLKCTFLVNGESFQVCKKFFLATLAISETVVRNAIKKSNDGFVRQDMRGRKTPPNKTSDNVKDTVRNHINMVPKYESHYSREKTRRRYLGSHLNIERLYFLYTGYCTEQQVPTENIAKEWLYRHIFNTEYNIGFNPPANDTCDDCDRFVVQLKNAVNDVEKADFQVQHDKHIEEANHRYILKRLDKTNALESNGTKKTITVDLQKCLPTPLLTNAQSFYFRKLWTFNYTIMDSVSKQSLCIMWDETIAGRGGNEMASGLLKFFEEKVSSNVTEVTIWSDNCCGQNKNISIIMAYMWIMSQYPNLMTINHKYLLKGHTHMEVDVIHSVIEREKKKMKDFKIVIPWDWQQLIRNCSKNDNIKVVNMETSDFKNFTAFCEGNSAPFVHRKKSNEGNIVPYSSIVWMQFRRDSSIMFYKTNFEQDSFQEVSLIRNKRRATGNLILPIPKPVRNNLKAISTFKYKDLQKTLQWIPTIFHNYYQSLSHESNVSELPEASDL